MRRNRLHVLLIEDDEDDLVLVQDLLADLEVEITLRWETTYDGGRAALQSGDYDVCIMDYRLGARDGLELLREMDTTTPVTPIIFLTGEDSRQLDMEAMEAGAADYLVKGKIDSPLLERSIRYALERHRLLLEMHRRSLIDDLTGVLNRRGFEDQMVREMKLSARRASPMAVLFVDIDDFKAINDEHGHAEGDCALREVADLLTRSFRGSDIVARLGGDEFVVVALDTALRDASLPEKRLQNTLDQRNASTERPYRLSLTIGFALYDPEEPRSLWELVNEADHQMYDRKPARVPVHAGADGASADGPATGNGAGPGKSAGASGESSPATGGAGKSGGVGSSGTMRTGGASRAAGGQRSLRGSTGFERAS
jgi:diguanylate cyclase (GGDEF)-like protein